MAPATRLAALAIFCLGVSTPAAADGDRIVKPLQWPAGKSVMAVEGSVQGRRYVDYQLRAGAGQTLGVRMQAANRANYFNVLPPGSTDVAMFVEGAGDAAFEGRLPDDGLYTIRVYLVRAAARRNESGRFALSIRLDGVPLAALPAKADALVPGTRFHATAKVPCAPPYSKARECDAGVVRRGADGTATVELRWESQGKRRILFVKGTPETADVPQPFTFTRDEKGYVIVFGPEERFEIPEALVFGG